MAERTILITGCSSGIGLDAARTLTARGWRVFASCRQPNDCERLRAEGLDSPRIDHADPGSISEGVAEVFEKTGGTLDALYNNAAFGLPALLEDVPRGAMEEIFHANFFGVHDLTRQITPAMRAQGHGRIVTCSSVLGLVSIPWRGPYAATKFALEAWADALRVEMRGTGIDVSLIEPGPIGTQFRKNSIAPYERWIKPREAARSQEYRDKIEARLYHKEGPDPFERPAAAVTRKLIHALESPRPKPRYYVTVPTYILSAARHVLPIWLMDRILAAG